MLETKNLSVVLTKEHSEDDGTWWIAQLLEHDIAAQARTLEDALYDLSRMIVGRMIAAAELGVDPFADVPPASLESWDLFRSTREFRIIHEPEFAAREARPARMLMPKFEARVAH